MTLDTTLQFIKRFIPHWLFARLQPAYHYLLAVVARMRFGNPSRKLFIVGVTGTKGKSTVVELLNAIFEDAGYQTALANTIHFKIGDESKPNLFKMTMPGRFFMQRFLREALMNGCQYVFIEMTSEGAKLYRHHGIELNALIFTNLTPEHIESHGSFPAYRAAKLRLVGGLNRSPKEEKYFIANADDPQTQHFLEYADVPVITYSLKDADPHAQNDRGNLMTIEGVTVHSKLVGTFNIYNTLAAVAFAKTQGLDIRRIKPTLERVELIPGRVERVNRGQNFTVVIDYAHTPDSLAQLYEAFGSSRKICVLGNTGGGRDAWKRPEMGRIADQHCDTIILTNEDPYDEDPRQIVEHMKQGIEEHTPRVIMDRRQAIRAALKAAKKRDVVLITGKGTDPYIMGPRDSREPWSDADVTREELDALLHKAA